MSVRFHFKIRPVICGSSLKEPSGKVMFAEVNVDENQQAAMKYVIMSIPTIIIFKDGKEIERFVGLQPENVLSIAIEKALK